MIDSDILLYYIAQTFKNCVGIAICGASKRLLKTPPEKIVSLVTMDKTRYNSYASLIVNQLSQYKKDITLFELNTDKKCEVPHDFRICQEELRTRISLDYDTFRLEKSFVLDKLMTICGCSENNDLVSKFCDDYKDAVDEIYADIKGRGTFSDLSEDEFGDAMKKYLHVLYITLSKKKKPGPFLFNHLFYEEGRMIIKISDNDFYIYDFTIPLNNINSYSIKKIKDSMILMKFNNGAEFYFFARPTEDKISKNMSCTFNVMFKNINQIFNVGNVTID